MCGGGHLVVGDVPVQVVELRCRHCINRTLDQRHVEVVPRCVDHKPTPLNKRPVVNGQRHVRPKHV